MHLLRKTRLFFLVAKLWQKKLTEFDFNKKGLQKEGSKEQKWSKKSEEDTHTVLVGASHPKLKTTFSTLKSNFHITVNNLKIRYSKKSALLPNERISPWWITLQKNISKAIAAFESITLWKIQTCLHTNMTKIDITWNFNIFER